MGDAATENRKGDVRDSEAAEDEDEGRDLVKGKGEQLCICF